MYVLLVCASVSAHENLNFKSYGRFCSVVILCFSTIRGGKSQ